MPKGPNSTKILWIAEITTAVGICYRSSNLITAVPEVSQRGWREGVGSQEAPKIQQKFVPRNCVLILIRGHRNKGAEKKA